MNEHALKGSMTHLNLSLHAKVCLSASSFTLTWDVAWIIVFVVLYMKKIATIDIWPPPSQLNYVCRPRPQERMQSLKDPNDLPIAFIGGMIWGIVRKKSFSKLSVLFNVLFIIFSTIHQWKTKQYWVTCSSFLQFLVSLYWKFIIIISFGHYYDKGAGLPYDFVKFKRILPNGTCQSQHILLTYY